MKHYGWKYASIVVQNENLFTVVRIYYYVYNKYVAIGLWLNTKCNFETFQAMTALTVSLDANNISYSYKVFDTASGIKDLEEPIVS